MTGLKNISIKNKLISIQVITAFMAVLICCVFFVFNEINILKDSAVQTEYSIIKVIGDNAISPLLFNDKDAATGVLLSLKNNPNILNAAIFDKTGKEFAVYTKKGGGAFSFPMPQETGPITHNFLEQGFIVSYKIFQEKEFVGTVIFRAGFMELNDIIYNNIKIAVVILVIGIVAAFLFSTFLQGLITKRLLSLVSQTNTVAETGNYSIRIVSEEKDEIGTLTNSFNNMMEQIEKMEKTLKNTNIELEKRVKARTIELETLNRMLHKKSGELVDSNKELEQFAYVASHDLQEPLRTISNFVELLEEKYAGRIDEDADQYLKFIMTATAKMQNLIRDLLELSRIGRNITFSPIDCNKVLESVTTEMQLSIKESNAKIASETLPVVMGNEIELKQLFQNILSNAIKFRKKESGLKIEITVEDKNTEYLFAVKDNGIGIEEQYKEKIFVIFQRLNSATEYPGTGIGLATCRKIVALLNGKIWVESKLGEGSTFYFTIPKKMKEPLLVSEEIKMQMAIN